MSVPYRSTSTVALSLNRSVLRRILRWFGFAVAGIATLVVAALVVLNTAYSSRASRRFNVAEPSVALVLPDDSATISEGRHQAVINGCTSCHGDQLQGRVDFDNPPIGRMAPRNLTLGGHGADLTPRDWSRAVRQGVRRDSTSLIFMPSAEYTHLSDEHLAAIIAYARSLPAVRTTPPSSYVGPVARALLLRGDLPALSAETVNHDIVAPLRVTAERTVAFGKYVGTACKGCHGDGYSGGVIPGAPPGWGPAANITPMGLARYTRETFVTAMRTGRRADGSTIKPPMPIKAFAHMTDVELDALWLYLRSLPPRPYGQR
jgi:cytochrome c553/mono/diheme cytochrome c family protein